MKFAIQVQPNRHWKESQRLARTLCDDLQKQGHQIVAVFFYGQATQITASNNNHDWLDWDHNTTPLLVCSTLNNQTNLAEDNNKLFTITGMARWMDLLEQAEQLLVIP